MEFSYNASTAEGSMMKGVVEADSVLAAEETLWRSGLTIIDLRRSIHLPPLEKMLPSLFGVKRSDLIQFSRNIASLLDAGIPILRALTIQSRFGKRSLKGTLHDIGRDLEKGSRFSEACAKYPAIFPTFFIYLLKTGEEAGNLSQVLQDVAKYMEKDEATASKIKRSLAYPGFVVLLAIGAVFVMLTFVVPAITSLFAELGGELPLLTRIFMALGDFFSANFLYMAGGIAFIGVAGYAYQKTPRGKKRKDKLMLKLPLIGNAVLKGGLARFTRNVSMLIGAGIPLFEALRLMAETTDNAVLAESLENARIQVNNGKLLSEALGSDPIFPALMPEMIRVGEETGTLEPQLVKVSTVYEEEADRAIAQVTGMLTPALTVGVGFIIGLVAVAMFSSIYSVVGALPE